MDQGSIRTVNARLASHLARISGVDCQEAETFANKRAAAKFEQPNSGRASSRQKAAWDRWIQTDQQIPSWEILGPQWATARLLIRKWLADFRVDQLTFTNGSSFEPLGPNVSIACKLTCDWTVTSDCFDLFAKLAYRDHAFVVSVKKRFLRHCQIHKWHMRAVNAKLWRRFKSPFKCFEFKLFCVVKFVNGNRYSTVPKNNLKDRSICLEPLCNMFVQRAVGLGLRASLKRHCGVDLNVLADVHRTRISDSQTATIDLSDCSDTISLRLVEYLVPKHVLSAILASRSDMTLGLDDNFHVVNKVSSMGNGFTFDLMSMILLALTRSIDPTSTVFGDDIICHRDAAVQIISNLTRADFRVNESKTNIGTGFRESCGANYIDGYGYVTSFDLKWVTTTNDLIVTLNKVAILSQVYGGQWTLLSNEIRTCVPPVLLGATTSVDVGSRNKPPSYNLSDFVRYGPRITVKPTRAQLKVIRRAMIDYQYTGPISVGLYNGVSTRVGPSSLKASDWDMFLQNIHASRKMRRVSALCEKTSLMARVGEDLIGPLGALRSSNRLKEAGVIN